MEEPRACSIEKLKVYDEALASVARLTQLSSSLWAGFLALPGGAELSSRLFRQIDRAATSVVLNIVEGNGRPKKVSVQIRMIGERPGFP